MYENIKTLVFDFIGDHLMIHVLLILLSAGLLLLAMFVDLISGIRKAKALHQATTSTGLKKTAEKAQKYFGPYMELVCIDLISCIVVPIPAFSMLWAAYCIFCEYRSVQEKSWQKAELRKAEKTLSLVIENKDDIAKLVAELLTKNNKEDPNNEND